MIITAMCGVLNLVVIGQSGAQNVPGLPNASGNQPIRGNAQGSTAVNGIQGDPNRNITGYTAYGPSPAPWFGNDNVREQFGVTENQYEAFSQNGWQAFQGYTSAANGPNNPAGQQWQASRGPQGYSTGSQGPQGYSTAVNPFARNAGNQQLQGQGYSTGANSLGANVGIQDWEVFQGDPNALNTPSVRPRVRVMSNSSNGGSSNQPLLQYNGYGASYGPSVETMTPSQRANMARQQRDYERQLAQYRRQFRVDPAGVSARFSDGRQLSQQRFDSPVNLPEGQVWNQMSGTAFEFPVDVYFTSGGSEAPAGQ